MEMKMFGFTIFVIFAVTVTNAAIQQYNNTEQHLAHASNESHNVSAEFNQTSNENCTESSYENSKEDVGANLGADTRSRHRHHKYHHHYHYDHYYHNHRQPNFDTPITEPFPFHHSHHHHPHPHNHHHYPHNHHYHPRPTVDTPIPEPFPIHHNHHQYPSIHNYGSFIDHRPGSTLSLHPQPPSSLPNQPTNVPPFNGNPSINSDSINSAYPVPSQPNGQSGTGTVSNPSAIPVNIPSNSPANTTPNNFNIDTPLVENTAFDNANGVQSSTEFIGITEAQPIGGKFESLRYCVTCNFDVHSHLLLKQFC